MSRATYLTDLQICKSKTEPFIWPQVHVSVHLSLSKSSNLLYGYSTVYLSIYQLIHIWIISSHKYLYTGFYVWTYNFIHLVNTKE